MAPLSTDPCAGEGHARGISHRAAVTPTADRRPRQARDSRSPCGRSRASGVPMSPSASLEQVDLAKNLAALAATVEESLLPKMRDYAAGLVTAWATPEKADDLAAVLEETARQVRLCRPDPAVQEEKCPTVNDAEAVGQAMRSDDVQGVRKSSALPPSSPFTTSRWRSALDAMDLVSTATTTTVRPVVASDRSANASSDDCPQCQGGGVIKWTQPDPDGSGGFVLREMTHPCPRGCGPQWKHPNAERERVVDGEPDNRPVRVEGHAKAANQLPPELDDLLAEIYKRHGRD